MKRLLIILTILLILLVGGGVLIARFLSQPSVSTSNIDSNNANNVGVIEKNTEVEVTVQESNKANTIVLTVNNLQKKYVGIEYEITYDSEGLIKGVNSGSQPIEIEDQETFEKEVYLGTCSRNVCKPDTGVSALSVVLQFVDIEGKKSQFTQDFLLE